MKVLPTLSIATAAVCLSLPACQMQAKDEARHESQKVVLTSPEAKDVVVTQQYVCQIRSRRHIEVRAMEGGYLEEITIKEGQTVNQGDVMFHILPRLYQARMDAENAEVRYAEVEYQNTLNLFNSKDGRVVSQAEVNLFAAKLDKAKAKFALAAAEFRFATVLAPFDGIIDRLYMQQGSLVKEGKEGDVLTTLSDNSVMWVYFNVPEARYYEYVALRARGEDDRPVELVLANGTKFKQPASKALTVEGQFNNETGNIKFRADFPNPDRLLRHGQTGTVLIHRPVHNALVIPQRATFEVLDKQYVWVVGEDKVVHRRPITVANELEDTFVIESGLGVKDKFVLDGVQQVHDGDKLEESEFEKPGDALAHQKFHAE